MLRTLPAAARVPRLDVTGALAATLLVQATALMVAIVVYGALQHSHMADFHVMRDAAREILQGRSGAFVYPPPAAFALIPPTFLPHTLAAVIWVVLILAS